MGREYLATTSRVSGENSEPRSFQSCSLLAAGRAFSGTLNAPSVQISWRVNVLILECDLEQGYICGTMEDVDVPMEDSPVVTFWEGEIVDNKNYTFFTGKWDSRLEEDIMYWTKFQSLSLLGDVMTNGGKCLDLSDKPFIYMRWKDHHCLEGEYDSTIDGFYYICFSRSDGSISGFYYDLIARPLLKLELKPTINDGRSGVSFSSYELQ